MSEIEGFCPMGLVPILISQPELIMHTALRGVDVLKAMVRSVYTPRDAYSTLYKAQKDPITEIILEQMEELAKLSAALKNSSSLLLNQRRNILECQFVEKGLVRQVLPVRCVVLAAALWQASLRGILEGFEFRDFKHSFESFSICVKARKLYRELSATLPLASEAQHTLASA